MSQNVATTSPATNIAGLLERMKPQMAAALPKTMSADRMARIALTAFRTTPALQRCDPQSFIASVMQAAQLGLEPNLNGSAYLVPFKKKWKEGNQWMERMECQMIPGYRGLIDLARRSGAVQSISAEIVYERDAFKLFLGVENRIEHTPYLDGDRGAFKLVYAVATFKDGGYQFIWMSKGQVDAIRERSKAKDSGPWVTDYEEMVKKTAIRRLCKMLPMSVELAAAVAISDAADIGVRPVIDGDVVMLPTQVDGASDDDESEASDASEKTAAPTKPAMTAEAFEAGIKGWTDLIASGKKTAKQVITMLETKNTLSLEQHAQLTQIEVNQ